MHLIHVTTLFSRGGTPHEMKYEVNFFIKKKLMAMNYQLQKKVIFIQNT